MSNHQIQRVLNTHGNLRSAADALHVHSSTLTRIILARKINWKPSEKSKAMLKAARTNPLNHIHTEFSFGHKNGFVSSSIPKRYVSRTASSSKQNYGKTRAPTNAALSRTISKFIRSLPNNILADVAKDLVKDGTIKVTI